MSNLKYKGYTYELIVRPWKKGNSKYECIKWINGFRNLWERITYNEYLQIKNLKNNKT